MNWIDHWTTFDIKTDQMFWILTNVQVYTFVKFIALGKYNKTGLLSCLEYYLDINSPQGTLDKHESVKNKEIYEFMCVVSEGLNEFNRQGLTNKCLCQTIY